MRTFYYPRGHARFSAMTVAELRALLAKYPDDMPVMAEWEAHYVAVPSGEEGIFRDGNGDDVPVLVLSAED